MPLMEPAGSFEPERFVLLLRQLVGQSRFLQSDSARGLFPEEERAASIVRSAALLKREGLA
jgi:hypothetical protein